MMSFNFWVNYPFNAGPARCIGTIDAMGAADPVC